MAVLKVEDLTGSCDAVVFPKTYAKLVEHLILETRILLWGNVDRRDDSVQLIVDDCREIDEMKFLLVDLLPDQAGDIRVQNRLRDCLNQHKPGKDEVGIRVPVVAAIREGDTVSYVRLGHQFCVRDVHAAADSLGRNSFQAHLTQCLAI